MNLSVIKEIAEKRKLSLDHVGKIFADAIVKALSRKFDESVFSVDLDIEKNKIFVYQNLNVVEDYEDLNDYVEIAVNDAKKIDDKLEVGSVYRKPINLNEISSENVRYIFGIFNNSLNAESNKNIYDKWSAKIGQVVNAEVDQDNGNAVVVDLTYLNGNESELFGHLARREQIPGEKLEPGTKYNFLIKDVKQSSTDRWPIILSRASAELVKQLLIVQIPELQENIIEIKKIARVPGFKTKIAVITKQHGIDPVGTIIGPQGSRIKNVSDLINGEKIEVVQYDEDFEHYVVNACSPATVTGLKLTTTPGEKGEKRKLIIITYRDQLPLIIGKAGKNVRVLSELLECNIEVYSDIDAMNSNIQYDQIDPDKFRQRAFERTTKRYASMDHDFLSNISSFNKDKKNNFYQNNKKKTNVNNVATQPSETVATSSPVSNESKPLAKEENIKTKEVKKPKLSKTTRNNKSNLEDVLAQAFDEKKHVTNKAKVNSITQEAKKSKVSDDLLEAMSEFKNDDYMNQIDFDDNDTKFDDLDLEYDDYNE